jgi:O-succinylhomoserine sulfhydrylase
VKTSFVSQTATDDWEAATTPDTRLFFLETPSNPLTEISDIARLVEIARAKGILTAVDNCFCTPVLQRPLEFGIDIVMHSATKFIDGQGRVLGGAVVTTKERVEEMLKFMRSAGPALSPFNAWVLLKGLETLKIRVEAQSAGALHVARWLEGHSAVARVYYPGLESHPQYALAQRQQKGGGAIVAFEVKGARAEAWRVVDRCEMLSVTANLGDVKTTLTHPATTTHGRLSPEQRAASGIGEGLLRLSIGLEAPTDIEADLERGLSRL